MLSRQNKIIANVICDLLYAGSSSRAACWFTALRVPLMMPEALHNGDAFRQCLRDCHLFGTDFGGTDSGWERFLLDMRYVLQDAAALLTDFLNLSCHRLGGSGQ